MTDIDTIADHTYTARQARQEEHGWTGLDGYCHENAVYLCEYFYTNTEYTPYLRWGIVNRNNKDYTSLQEAEKDGAVHFWVQVPNSSNNWIHTDLFVMQSPDDHIVRGQLFTNTTLPTTYETFENTLFKYNKTITPTDLLSFSDYQELCDRHPPVR